MKRIITDRSGGKTTRLIRMAAETGGYIVCHEPHYVAEQASRMGVNIAFPLSYSEFLDKKYYARGVKGFLFDNIDNFMQTLSGSVPVFAVTVSTEDEP